MIGDDPQITEAFNRFWKSVQPASTEKGVASFYFESGWRMALPEEEQPEAEAASYWQREARAEKANDEIREILADTTRPGCFGGLAHPGMDYSQAMQRIGEVVGRFQEAINNKQEENES